QRRNTASGKVGPVHLVAPLEEQKRESRACPARRTADPPCYRGRDGVERSVDARAAPGDDRVGPSTKRAAGAHAATSTSTAPPCQASVTAWLAWGSDRHAPRLVSAPTASAANAAVTRGASGAAPRSIAADAATSGAPPARMKLTQRHSCCAATIASVSQGAPAASVVSHRRAATAGQTRTRFGYAGTADAKAATPASTPVASAASCGSQNERPAPPVPPRPGITSASTAT